MGYNNKPHPRGPLATQKYTSYLRRYIRSTGIGLGTTKSVEELDWDDRSGKSGHFCAEKDTPGINTAIEPIIKIKIKWDGTEEYEIQNNNNYSWEVVQDPPETFNPASANNSYCNNGGKWFLNNNEVATFNDSSYYEKEIPPGKIVWDDNQEYIINNPDNYSYEIINYTRIATTNPGGDTGTIFQTSTLTGIDIYRSIDGQTIGGYSGTVPVNEAWAFVRVDAEWGSPGETVLFNPTITNVTRSHLSGTDIGQALINGVNQNFHYWNKYNIQKILRIRDGNTNTDFNIANPNSVQVVNVPSTNAKFKFFNNGNFTEITADKNSVVSVSCTILTYDLEITDGGILSEYNILDTNSVIEEQNNLYNYTITDTVKTENHEIAVENPTENYETKGYEWLHKRYLITSSGNPCNPSGFTCTCPDFTQQEKDGQHWLDESLQESNGVTRSWAGSAAGPFNPCKHIMAVKRLLGIEQSYGGYP
jgi:hypothetical protein